MRSTIVRRPSAFLPVAMSVVALGIIGVRIAVAGTAPERDEGAAAHAWQLLMVGQVPLIGYFAATSVLSAGVQGLVVLAVQLLAALAAAAPVFVLHW